MGFKDIKLRIVRFFNGYALKEYFMLLKYHSFSEELPKKPMLISTVDHKRNTQGMADRFKGIVSVYALSKATNSGFKIIYNHPFLLQNFLLPNQYNWIIEDKEIDNSIKNIRYKILRKQPSIKRLLKLLPLKKQVRIYANLNYLEEINQKFQKKYIWGDLFKELFIPTKELQEQIDYHTETIGKDYIACVFRFQSLLGDFEEYNNKSLPELEQTELIRKNKNSLEKLSKDYNLPILVTSDSGRFLSEIKSLPNVYILPGKVVHLDCAFEENLEVYMKSFLDFFMISGAKKVFSMGTKNMYPTEFPMYAAKVNNVPFERILID